MKTKNIVIDQAFVSTPPPSHINLVLIDVNDVIFLPSQPVTDHDAQVTALHTLIKES